MTGGLGGVVCLQRFHVCSHVFVVCLAGSVMVWLHRAGVAKGVGVEEVAALKR